MRKQKVVRFTRSDFDVLKKHFQVSGHNESQAFTLFSHALGRDCDILIGTKLIVPDPDELKNQSSISIEPSKKFQAIAYGSAYDTGLSVGDEHTHPFTEEPQFSAIDDYHGTKNAIYLSEHLPEPATMLMIVFGRDLRSFQARVWNRSKSCFEPITRLEILGSPIEILCNGTVENIPEDDPYARHRIIPGWEQGRLEKLKVFVCGLGGNGALVWGGLLALGVGKESGWLKACDPDVLEASNLPRIPYALPRDVGKPKAKIAQRYAHHKAPGIKVSCYQENIATDKMQQIAKEANVIIEAVDNDGGRKIGNNLSIRYAIPLVNISSEIIPDKPSYEAVGQIQIVLPGQTGCLMCSGTIDPSEAALDLLPEELIAKRARAGYVRGTEETPTPSVLHLNGVTSHLGISQFLRLVLDEGLSGKAYFHYEGQNCQLIAASVPPNVDCPVCGTKGYLGAGDEVSEVALDFESKQSGTVMLVNGEVVEESKGKNFAAGTKPKCRVSMAKS